MPASMIRPEVGSSLNVSGSSMAMVAMGPMPGSTPISVPTMAPMNANPRLTGVNATENPTARLWKSSMTLPLGPDGNRQAEADDKDRPGEHDENDRGDRRLQRPQARRRNGADPGEQQNGDHQPQVLDGEAEDHQARGHEQRRPPRKRRPRAELANATRLAQALDQDEDAEGKQDPAQEARHVAGAHAQRRADGIVARHPQAEDRDACEHQAGKHVLMRQHLPHGGARRGRLILGHGFARSPAAGMTGSSR